MEPKLYRGYDKKESVKQRDDLDLGFEAGYRSRKLRKRKKHELGLSELKEILRLVLQEGTTQREAAELFNVKPTLVTSLVRNEKLKSHGISQLEEKQKARVGRVSMIKSCIDAHLDEKRHIWTTQ